MKRASIGALLLCAVLAACGGGSETGDFTAASGSAANTSTLAPASGVFAATAATASGFTATLAAAPANDTYLCSMTTLEVHGSGLKNVELLPPTGYAPKYGTFTVSADGTVARLQFDPAQWPNGELRVRISAFDAAAGQPANEIVVMPERRWLIANNTPPCVSPGSSTQPPPTPAFQATLTSAPADGTTLCSMARLEVQGRGIKNVELLPPSGYTPKYGSFTVSADGTLARLHFDPKAWPNGELRVRISTFDAAAGQPANEIVVMPERRWLIANNVPPCVSPGSSTPPPPPPTFTATLTSAPADGSYVCSMTTLEVQGSRIRNVELLPPNGYTPKYSTFTVSADGTLARTEFDPKVWPNGEVRVKISAFDAPAGQPGNEIVVTRDRRWLIANGTPPCVSPGTGG